MTDNQTQLFGEPVPDVKDAKSFLLAGPGQARHTDPDTAQEAARLIRAKATTARVRLLYAFDAYPDGLTDEQAASIAGLSLASEYATRCSELDRAEMLEDTGRRRRGRAGAERMVRRITPLGHSVIVRRGYDGG